MSDADEIEGRQKAHLKRAEIKGLFGDVDLDFQMEKDITFFHGRNGEGKTTAFRLIQAATSSRLRSTLETIPFTQLILHFSDGGKLVVTAQESDPSIGRDGNDHDPLRNADDDETDRVLLEYELTLPTKEQFTADNGKATSDHEEGRDYWHRMQRRLSPGHILQKVVNILSDLAPETEFNFKSPSRVQNTATGQIQPIWEWIRLLKTTNELATIHAKIQSRYGRILLFASDRLRTSGISDLLATDPDGGTEDSEELDDWRHRSAHFDFVRERERKDEMSVHRLSRHVRDQIARIQKKIGEQAAQLDQTFVNQVLKTENEPSRDSVAKRQLSYRKEIESSGNYFDSEEEFAAGKKFSELEELPKAALPFLDALFETMHKRYRDRFSYAERARKFEKLMETRLRRGKRVLVRPTGLTALRDDEKSIPLGRLSSGEQHQLVTLYALIFLADEDSLILFDEPEISLHPEWQELFCPTMLEIHRERGHQFVVATHAPDIIGNARDKVRPMRLDAHVDKNGIAEESKK